MDTERIERDLKEQCSQRLAATQRGYDVIERFKLHALKNGCAGIKNIGRLVLIKSYVVNSNRDLK